MLENIKQERAMEKEPEKKRQLEVPIKLAEFADLIRDWSIEKFNIDPNQDNDETITTMFLEANPNFVNKFEWFMNNQETLIGLWEELGLIPPKKEIEWEVIEEEWGNLLWDIKKWVKTAAITAGAWLGILAMGKKKTETISPRQKENILRWKWKLPLKEQRLQATLLKEYLKAPDKTIADLDNITKEFATDFKPVKDFDELLSQVKYKLKDNPWSVIRERNDLLSKYNTTHWYEYLDWIKKYRKSIANDPQKLKLLDKVDEIIANEQSFIKSKWDKLSTIELNKRKEQLWNNLKRFLNKDLTVLSDADMIEQQALNKLRDGAKTEIEKIADGTPDSKRLKELNKKRQTYKEMEWLLEPQKTKFKWVKRPTRLEKTLTKLAKLPIVWPRIKNAAKEKMLTQNQRTLDNIYNFTKKITKKWAKWWFQLLKWWTRMLVNPTVWIPMAGQHFPEWTTIRKLSDTIMTLPEYQAFEALERSGQKKEKLIEQFKVDNNFQDVKVKDDWTLEITI